MVNVSVIVPVYNTERYLQRCLDSLVQQTLEELEIILVDDGSTDASGQILTEYEIKYPKRIKVYTKENGGQATARNLGIQKSSGKYIGFVDSDDYVDTKMFETMYRAAEQGQYDLVECNYRFLCEEGKRTKELRTRGNIRQYRNRKDMYINPQVSPWNKLYRREVLMHRGVDFPEGLIYEDTAFYIKTLPFVKKEKYVDERFVNYFLRGSSTMNANKSRKVGNILLVMENILEFYKDNHIYVIFRAELEYFCVKTLLCSSLSRIGRIPNKKIADELYEATFAFIQANFPEYKKNQYFHGLIGMYSRIVNQVNSKYIGKVLSFIMKG
jgi:glycosyltransferase involved in cell wall biosynthesis